MSKCFTATYSLARAQLKYTFDSSPCSTLSKSLFDLGTSSLATYSYTFAMTLQSPLSSSLHK